MFIYGKYAKFDKFMRQKVQAFIENQFPQDLSSNQRTSRLLLEAFLVSMSMLSAILIINLFTKGTIYWLPVVGYLFFFIIFLILLLLVYYKKDIHREQLIVVPLYALFCLVPFDPHNWVQISLILAILFPIIASFCLDTKKGFLTSIVFFIPLFLLLKTQNLKFQVPFLGIYTVSVIISTATSSLLNKMFISYEEKKRELEGLRSQHSKLFKIYLQDFEYRLKDHLTEINETEYRELLDAIADMIEKKDEFFVFYRKDVLDTLRSVPQPDAVLSYILLEGISEVNLFCPTDKESVSEYKNIGKYLHGAFTVEDLFDKVESVIDFREAKKNLEFNKIQSQLNRVFPMSTEEKNKTKNFDILCSRFNISEREIDVTRCVLKGLTNKEISQELYISIETVKTHIKNILKKCEISSRIELIKLFTDGTRV